MSHDGRYLVAAVSDGTGRVFAAATGREVARFEGFPDGAVALALNPDGRIVFRGGSTAVVVHTGSRTRTLQTSGGPVAAAAWMPDGSAVAAVVGDRVELLDPTGGSPRSLGSHPGANRIAFSADGGRLVTSDPSGRANLWDLGDGSVLPHIPDRLPVYAASVAGHRLVVAAKGLQTPVEVTGVEVRDTADSIVPVKVRTVLNVAFSPHGTQFLATVGNGVHVLDPRTGESIKYLAGAGRSRAVFSPCGRYIGVGQTVYDTRDGFSPISLPFPKPTGHLHDVAFQPGGHTVAVATANGSGKGVLLYDLPSRTHLRTLPTKHWAVSLAFSPDGRYLAVGTGTLGTGNSTRTAPLLVYEIAQGKLVRQIDGFWDGVWSVAWSPDGRWIATGSGVYLHRPMLGEVKVWDAGSGELVYDLKGHTDCVWGVSFSPDGRRLASAGGGRPGSVRDRGEFIIWDLVSGQQLLYGRTPGRTVAWATFSPDGRWFATAETDRIRLWDLTPSWVAPPPRLAAR